MKRSTDPMPPDVRARLFKLRCLSKSGGRLLQEENDFCADCYAKWPDEYSAMSRDVFEATKPFGSI